MEGGPEIKSAADLLKTGFLVWLYTIIAFSFLYWVLDGGGPESRFLAPPQFPDLAFPSQLNPGVARPGWHPEFFDYAPNISQKAVASSPRCAPAVKTLNPVSAAAFGAGGGQGDNPQLARLAIDAQSATGWHTDLYTSARFGNLYPGTGLLLDMGRAVTITSVRISLGRVPGAAFQLRVGARPALIRLPPAVRANNAGGVVRLRLTSPAHGRYVLVWFTRLPADPAGTFQAGVYNIRLDGHA